jgi:hypothetical protein
VTALNRIILALILLLSFGLHQAMQCQTGTTESAAPDGCSHEHDSCHHRSTPVSPIKSCCATSVCLAYAECSGIEEAAVSQAEPAHFQPVAASASIFPLAAEWHSPRVSLGFHSPPAQVPFFVTQHAFLI